MYSIHKVTSVSMSGNIYFSVSPVNVFSILHGLYFLPRSSVRKGRKILEHILFIFSIFCSMFLVAPIYICLSHYIFTYHVDLMPGNNTELTPRGTELLDKVSPVLLTTCIITVSITCRMTNIFIVRSRIPPLIKGIHNVDIALGVSDKLINKDRCMILWWTAITAFITSIDLTSCFYENCRTINGFELLLTLPVCLASVAPLCIELQFFVVCRIIEGRFRKLNIMVTSMNNIICKRVLRTQRIPTVGNNRNTYFFLKHEKLSHCLESLRFHYQTLRECSKELNLIYQRYLFISFICCFLEGLLCSYSFALSLTGKYERRFGIIPSAHLLFRTMYCLSRIGASSLAGMTVENEASKTEQFVIQLDSREIKDEIKEEIRLFTQYLSSNKLSFTVYGLCHLNVRLISSMLATILTYLIIMLQLG